jgi:ubiquinone/menaquinone biosynthesis C-methylase UbiE
MDTETLAKSPIGRIFIRAVAAVMESRLRYRFFGPTKILHGAGIRSGMKVLEVGCGTGFFTIPAGRMLGGQGSLIAINLSIFDRMLGLAVIPAKPGIQGFQAFLDLVFRRGDVLGMEFSLS